MEGARVELSLLSEDDRDELVDAMVRSREFHGPWITPPTTSEEFDELLQRTEDDSFVALVIRLREDRRIAGVFQISQIFRKAFQSGYLGYSGVAGLEGQGYMTEGMRLVLDYAFGELGLHRLEANIQPGNTASIALVGRCGFVKEGFSEKYLKIGGDWRDHERWAIRSEIWNELGGAGLHAPAPGPR
jgi:ribosomal-protein-alanine N-acetyltransferase